MRTLRTCALGLQAVVVVTACNGSNTTHSSATETAHLRQRSEQLVSAEAQRDIDRVLKYYAPDAIIEPPSAPVVKGHEAIRELYKEFYRTVPFVTFTATITTLEVSRAADLAYETGINRFEFDRRGARSEDLGKYLTVWRKVNGEWLVVAVAFSGDHPPS